MDNKNNSVYEQYKSEIYRIGWRIQYRTKKIRNNEFPLYENSTLSSSNFTFSSEKRVLVWQLLNKLPPNGKIIMDKLYLQGLTEIEVAQHLHISQQAVSKCKKKMIQLLSQTSNY